MRARRIGGLIAILTLSLASAYGAGAVPSVALQAPGSPFIGDPLSFTLTFSNTSPNITGYGPYIDLIVPATGEDGTDGIRFTSASFLGAPVTATVLTFDASGNATHPYAKDNTGKFVVVNIASFPNIKVGDKLVVLQLPFGSFTPTQPPAPVTVSLQLSNMADVAYTLHVYARGGFQFGNDPLDNPTVDPTIIGATATATILPTVLTAALKNDAPESETATGPNFPHQFTVSVNIAAGQKLTSLDMTDILPPNLQFVSLVSVTPNFPEASNAPVIVQTPVAGTPGGKLQVRLTPKLPATQFTAVAGVNVTMTFQAYVPRLDASAAVIVPAATGAVNTSTNQATGSINWVPLNGTDLPAVVTSSVATDTLQDKSMGIQKGNSDLTIAGSYHPVPRDTIQYTLNIQVSDYFAFQNLIVSDVISDGQHIDPTFTPTLTFTSHGATSPAAQFTAANWNSVIRTDGILNNGLPISAALEGTTLLTLNVSAEAITRAFNGKFVGGGIPNGGTIVGAGPNEPPPAFPFGGTTLQIVYRTVIQDDFTDNAPSGNSNVKAHDVLNNTVTAAGDLLNVTNLSTNGKSQQDGSASSLVIAAAPLVKSIYAYNGITALPNPLVILPGDTLTYRLQFTIPTGDVEGLGFNDFLPLPIFTVGDPLADGSNKAWVFDDTIDAAAPASGHAKYGTTETLRPAIGHVPAVTINNANGSNTLTFTYGKYENLAKTTLVVDLLFTVTVGSEPFADNLFMTNQAQSVENSTQQPGVPINDNKIIQVILGEPGLDPIFKGVVGYKATGLSLGGLTFDAPTVAASSFTGGPLKTTAQAAAVGASDLLGGLVDGGDVVRFAVVLQNSGHADSFNVILTDAFPSGLQTPVAPAPPGINLTLHRGDGTLMIAGTDYTPTINPSDFTIKLIDKAPTVGAIHRAYDSSGNPTIDGSNAIIVTYDLQVATVASARSIILNKAVLTSFTSTPAGPNFVNNPPGLFDTAQVEMAKASLAKSLLSTSIVNAGDINDTAHAVIGEIATFQLVLSVPEGKTSAAQIVDKLPAGLQFSKINIAAPSSNVVAANPIGTGATPANVTITGVPATGQTLTYNFGDITDSNLDDATPGTITIVYDTIVMDVLGNQDTVPTVLANSAVFSHTYLDATGTVQTFTQSAQSASVTVCEPTLTVAETISRDNITYVASLPSAAPVVAAPDGGDTVYYKIVIANPNTARDTIAFNLFLNDVLPAQCTSPAIVSVSTSGGSQFIVNGVAGTPAVADFNFTGNTLNAVSTIDIQKNSTLTIVISASLLYTVQPNQAINNPATIRWASLPGAPAVLRNGGALTPLPGVNSSGNNAILDNYAATSANAACTILNPLPAKSIVTTSELHPAGNEVAIGEVVRYQLLWQIPQGVSKSLKFTDNLPVGLQYLNDGMTKVGFVSIDGANIASSAAGMSGAGLNIVGSQATIGTIHPAFVLPASAITPAVFGSGTFPVFSLGDVTNTESNDANFDFVIIEFNALVLNVVSNQAFHNDTGVASATPLNNSVQVTTLTSNRTSANVTVNIAEPVIVNLTNANSGAAPTDGGDAITYQVTFSNTATLANRSPAFNLVLTYTFDANLTPSAAAAVVVAAPTTPLAFASTPAVSVVGNVVTVTIDQLYPVADLVGTTNVTVTIPATVIAGVATGQKLTSTAALTYTSLPGANGTVANPTGSSTPGAPGTPTGKRDGSGGPGTDAGVLNNYAQSLGVSTTLAIPTIDARYKGNAYNDLDTSVATSSGRNLVVGEAALYDILVTLPEGVTKALIVNDALPSGLRLDTTFNGGVGYQIVTTAAASSGQLTVDFPSPAAVSAPVLSSIAGVLGNDGVGAKFTFGDTTVAGDNSPALNGFIIRVRVIATDVITNRAGKVLDGTASLSYNDPNTGASSVADGNAGDDPIFTIVEPILTVLKTVNPASGDAGDTISYTITISNASGQEAYDVTLNDVLPTVVNLPVIGSVTGAPAADFQIAAGVLQTTGGTLNITTGSTVTIVVNGTLDISVGPGQQIKNTAQVFWSSMPGANPDERTGTSVPNPTLGTIVNAQLDNYAIASSVASTTVGQVLVSKAFMSSSEPSITAPNLTIGEFATYRLTVSVPEGTTNNFRIVDNIPAGQVFVPGSVVLSLSRPSNISAAHPGTGNAAFGGSVASLTASPAAGTHYENGTAVNFDFGQIISNADNNDNDDTFSFTYQALVLDFASNQGLLPVASQTVLTNKGTSTIVGSGVSNPILVDPAGTSITVVEPQLSLTQTLSAITGDAGDTITFTLQVQHTPASASNAFDTVLTDLIPTGFTYVAGSVKNTAGVAPTTMTEVASSVNVTWAGANSIAPGQSSTITFQATLDQAVQPNQAITNTAQITYTTLPGAQTNLDNGPNGVTSGTDHKRSNSTSANGTCTVPVGTYAKSLFSSNEPGIALPNATIGETVTYALLVTLPKSTPASLTVLDHVPAGLNGTNVTIVTSAAASNGLLAADFSGTIPAPTVSFTAGAGNDTSIAFGAITVNNDAPENDTSFLILLDTVVQDVVGNSGVAPQTVLPNTATFTLPTVAPFTTPVVNVTLVEPKITVAKTCTPSVADAGDQITVTLTVKNVGASTSNNTVIQDVLDARFDATTVAQGVSGTDYPASYTASLAGAKVQYSGGSIAAGATQTFTFTVKLTKTVNPGDVITNTATETQSQTTSIVHPQTRTEPQASGSDTVTVRTNSIAGQVFHDINNDGLFNGGDVGLFGVTVKLTGNDQFGAAVSKTVLTMAGGVYAFTNVPPGPGYTITVTHSAGYFDGKATAGTIGGTTVGTPNGFGGFGSNTISAIALPAGAANNGITYNFGEILPSSLSGLVFDDTNSDYLFDGLDVGINGVAVTLSGKDDTNTAVSLNTTTAGGGTYSFANLRPGTYTLTKTPPVGYLDFYNQVGSQASGTVVTPPVAPNETIASIALNENTNGINNNFGEHQIASVSGFVYNDANNNGAMDAGEFGIPNVTVTLTGEDDLGNLVNVSTTTDAAGAYSFTNLRPCGTLGGYVLTVPTSPLSYNSGMSTPGSVGGTASSGPQQLNFTLPDGTPATGYLFGEIYAANPVKSIPSPASGLVQIGDVVRYRLVASLPRGTVKILEFRDDLPTGMTFVNDGKANVAFTSTVGAGVISSDTIGSPEAADPLASVTPSVALPGASISTGGNSVFFNFGDVTDTGNDANPEHVVVEFNAMVMDAPGNVRGTVLSNTFTVRYVQDGTGLPTDTATSNTVSVTVIEPTLTVTKVSSATPHHLGYIVPYTINITNTAPSNATAFDVLINDSLPVDLTLDVASIVVNPAASVVSNTSAGNTIALHLNQLAGGSTATITYNASVTTDITQFGAAITNSVNINWDTQPGSPAVQRSYGAAASDAFTVTGPGLALSKTDGQTVVIASQVLTYEITVTNAGTDIANNFTVTDTLPPNTTFMSNSAGGVFSAANGTVTWSGQTLAAGTTAPVGTYSVTLHVNDTLPAGVFSFTNTAVGTLSPGEIDPTPGNNTATDTDNLSGVPDLFIVKSGPATVLPGNIVVYTLTYSNVGTRDSIGVTITETVPLRTVFTAAVSTAGWSYAAGAAPGTVGTFNVGSVPAGAGGAITVAFLVDATVPVGFTQIDNTATIADDGSGGPDPTPLNNTSTVSTHIPTSDLLITKTVDKPHLSQMDVATFTITVTNAGPDTATNVVVTDALPAGLKLVSASPGQGTYDVATGIWAIDTLAKDGTATLKIATNLTIPKAVTNVATITAIDQYDPTPPDNTASAQVTPQLADLGVVKAVDPVVVSYGSNAIYTIVLTNNGPDKATNVLVNDVLPAGMIFVSFTATQGQYSISDGNWTVGSMLNGASATLTITATALSDTPVDNTVHVVSEDQFDTNPVNDTSTAILTPLHSGLVITKTVDNDVPMMGETVTFTITVTNSGPGNAPGVQVLDQLPVGLKLGTATPSQGSYDPSTYIWTIGTIATGASPSMTMTATVGASGSITNTASLVASAATVNSVSLISTASTTTATATDTSCFAVSFNFAKSHRDRLLFTTLCALPQSFSPAGQTVTFSLAGVSYSCTLDRSGQCRKGTHLVQLRPGLKGWVVLLRITNDDLKQIKGVVNENASRVPLTNLVLRVDVGGKTFVSRETRYFTARQNNSAALK